jgi:hypothetical protein
MGGTEEQELRPPANKVPACNLPKLVPEKRILGIAVDIRLSKDLVFRDRFDWDIGKSRLRPIEFARNLLKGL